MGKVIDGTFNGTGAALYLGLGFIPDWIEIQNLENAEDYVIRWDKNMSRSGERVEGIRLAGDDAAAITRTPLTKGTGVAVYRGGDIMTAASTVYLIKDKDRDKRDDGTGSAINKWTLGSSTDYTGNWNDVCSTTTVGEGSIIGVNSGNGTKFASVVAVTSNGEAANEVTLSEPLASGEITALYGMYDYLGAAVNNIIPAGIKLNDTTLNVSGELCSFTAGQYDV